MLKMKFDFDVENKNSVLLSLYNTSNNCKFYFQSNPSLSSVTQFKVFLKEKKEFIKTRKIR